MDFRQYALSTLLAGACLMPSAVWAECDDSGLPDGVTLVETNTPTGPQCLEVYYDDPPVVQFQASVTTCDLTGIEPGNEVVELMTPMGMICVELFHREAPLHVENFLHYVGTGEMVGTFFHRAITGFILQGGGYRVGPADFESIPATHPAVVNEPCTRDIPSPTDPLLQICSTRGNERGTIALAKIGGNPDSGTTNWFVNLEDNRTNLDNQNEGFTVFGRVLPQYMPIVDAIAALPTATRDDLAWIESAFQTGEFPVPLMTVPLDTALDAVGCWDPSSQVTALNENVIPNLLGLSPDPDNPTIPFTTLSTTCATAFTGTPSQFTGNPTPGGPSGCPFDVIGVGTSGPRSLTFPGGVQALWTLSCAEQQQTLVDRGMWQAGFQTHFYDQLVTINAATIEPSTVVPAVPPMGLGLLAIFMLSGAGIALRR